MFLGKVHALYPEPIKFFKLRAYCRGVKGGVICFFIELEKLWEEAVGEEIFLRGDRWWALVQGNWVLKH